VRRASTGIQLKNNIGLDYDRQGQIDTPEDNEDVLHPLREAANRVGREVERFAEVLDGYNPLRATERDEKYEITIDLIDLYYTIALETAARLRDQHEAERRKKDGLSFRKKLRGFKITQDDEDMEVEEADGRQFPVQQTTLEDLIRWEQEAQTWDLLRRLVHHRFSPSGPQNKGIETQRKLNQYSTKREVWEEFLESDNLALERKTVLQWLKDTAEETGEEIDVLVHDLQQNAERGDIIAHGWLHTKAAIKNQKRLHTWTQTLDPASAEVQRTHFNSAGTEPLITQLDPDAMTRQGRKLEAQDEYFERAIWLGCYEMLRRGKSLTEIKEWCLERTEIWRAVSMSGLPDEKPVEGDDEVGSAASNALWRRMCFALARKGGGDEYERAVYGILSGDISSVEPVCSSWDDFVFAHYNALLRTQFDNYLQKTYPQIAVSSTVSNFGSFDAVQFHGDSRTAGKRLVETLKTDPRTSKETSDPMKMLQGVLIADQFDKFIYQQGLALSRLANADGPSNLIPATDERPENEEINKYVALDDHDSLRVLTHMLLVFISLGLDMGGALQQTVIENVIVSYISFLRLAGKEELIPLYCSQLSGARRYATLSRNLIDVTDNEQRATQIKLMRELGLDVQEFVKFQSRYLFNDFPDLTERSDEYPAAGKFKLLEDTHNDSGRKVRNDFIREDDERIERIDMLLIRSLEWYLLVDGLWSETFIVGTMLYLRFFSQYPLIPCLVVPANCPQNTCTLLLLESSLQGYQAQILRVAKHEQ
jgi:nuclear pore complex protein Nup107